MLLDAIDLDAGTLTVRRALQRQTGKGLVLVEPKSKAGPADHHAPYGAVQRPAAAPGRADAAADSSGERLGGRRLRRLPAERPADRRPPGLVAWKALLKAAGVGDARLHDARHTAATLLLQQGVPAQSRHADARSLAVSLTLGTYSHVVPELADEAAERMGSALCG